MITAVCFPNEHRYIPSNTHPEIRICKWCRLVHPEDADKAQVILESQTPVGCWNCKFFTPDKESFRPSAYIPGTKYKGYCGKTRMGHIGILSMHMKPESHNVPVCDGWHSEEAHRDSSVNE